MSEDRCCFTCKHIDKAMSDEPCNTCFANWEVHDALYAYDVDRVCSTCRHQKANAINAPCGTCVSTNWEPKITSESLTEIHEETERKAWERFALEFAEFIETAKKMRKVRERLNEAFEKWIEMFYHDCPTCGKPIPENRKYCSIWCRMEHVWQLFVATLVGERRRR